MPGFARSYSRAGTGGAIGGAAYRRGPRRSGDSGTRGEGRGEASADAPDSLAGQVRRIVAQVTGHRDIEPGQSFAGLGIDSLQLMQIAVRVRHLAGKAFSISSLLAARSSTEIIALVTAAASGQTASSGRGAVTESDLSTPQERLWYLAQLDPGSCCYNVPFGWLMPIGVSANMVRMAVLAVLERHEILRSAYRLDSDGLARVTLRSQDVVLTETDLDAAGPDSSFGRIAHDFVEHPFDLERGSTRVLIVAGAERIRLVFVCHHVSIDAWSVRLIHDSLIRHLSGSGEVEDVPRASYRDFVQSERDIREGADYERQVEYWREALRHVRPTVPPPDPGMVPADTRPVGNATAVLPQKQLNAVRSALRAQGATLYAAGLTGLALALSQWCGTPEIVIGTNVANRARQEFETIVGLFVDPVVLRLAPGAGQPTATVGTALTAVRDQFISAISHSSIPYIDVVGLSETSGKAADNPLFAVITTMFNPEPSGSRLTSLEIPLPATAKFALAVEFEPRQDGLAVHALYAADRYLATTIERLLERSIRYLEALACDGPDALLSEVFPKHVARPARERFAQRFQQLHNAPGPLAGPGGK